MICAVVDPAAGTLNRFECAGGKVKLTHRYAHGGPCIFTADVVDEMRLMPPEYMSMAPDKPLPPCAAA